MDAPLGDRMKFYEGMRCVRVMPGLPVVIRIDGRSFHKWTKANSLKTPYDARMTDAMRQVTAALVLETNAVIGYTQSDEISLLLHTDDYRKELWFGGKLQKLISVSASIATNMFNAAVGGWAEPNAVFDARVFEVPTQQEGVNYLLWREQDAVRNSIQMLARVHFTHSQCMNKSSADLQDMLHTIGENWNDQPAEFKQGSYIQKQNSRPPCADYIQVLKHAAVIVGMRLSKVENKIETVFHGARFLYNLEQTVPWVGAIYHLVEHNQSEAAISTLFDNVERLLHEGEFSQCEDILRSIALDRLNIELVIGLLSITLAARDKLPYRRTLCVLAHDRIVELAPNRVESLLEGLV